LGDGRLAIDFYRTALKLLRAAGAAAGKTKAKQKKQQPADPAGEERGSRSSGGSSEKAEEATDSASSSSEEEVDLKVAGKGAPLTVEQVSLTATKGQNTSKMKRASL
jgi:hypothetical protein